MNLNLLVQAPEGAVTLAPILLGSKKRVGFLVGFGAQVGWVYWALLDHAYGLLPWCIFGGIVYGRGWWKWKHGARGWEAS